MRVIVFACLLVFVFGCSGGVVPTEPSSAQDGAAAEPVPEASAEKPAPDIPPRETTPSDNAQTPSQQRCMEECRRKGVETSICESYCLGDKGGNDKKPGANVSTLTVNGVTREYRLFVPKTLSTRAAPLLLAFHGGGEGDGAYFPQEEKFRQLAEDQGFLLAFPYAKRVAPNEGAWQLNTDASSQQDLQFVRALVKSLSERYTLDPKRLYATGYSLGSMFVYELACQAGDLFAAIASYAGTMPLRPKACNPTQFAALLHIHGKQDGIIPYARQWNWKNWDSVGTMQDIPSLVRYWKQKYSCQKEAKTTEGQADHVVHSGCAQGLRVEHYGLEKVGHEWPDRVRGVSTHKRIWDFLAGFKKP